MMKGRLMKPRETSPLVRLIAAAPAGHYDQRKRNLRFLYRFGCCPQKNSMDYGKTWFMILE